MRPSTGDERHVFQVQVSARPRPARPHTASSPASLTINTRHFLNFCLFFLRTFVSGHQEQQRYDQPHKAFTFRMHGFDSVVGPVKGVFDKEMSLNKAREHTLLRSDRPAYVTILSLGESGSFLGSCRKTPAAQPRHFDFDCLFLLYKIVFILGSF